MFKIQVFIIMRTFDVNHKEAVQHSYVKKCNEKIGLQTLKTRTKVGINWQIHGGLKFVGF